MDLMLDIQIVRAISAVGPLARTQIVNRISADRVDVEATLDAMILIGCVKTEMDKNGIFCYSLKTGFTERDCKSASHRQKIVQYVSKHGAKGHDLMPVVERIDFREGIERSIWKAMNNGQWMMVREVRDILAGVGFPYMEVLNTMNRLIDTGVWFDSMLGRNRRRFFKLKDSVECPPLPGAIIPTKVPVVSAIVSAPETVAAPVLAETKESLQGYFAIGSLSDEAIKAAQDAARMIVKEDHTLHEAIWALMDGDEYSCSDLVILLRPFGFTENQISPLLSKRFADGLLSRRLIEYKGRWFNVYTKTGELPEKFTGAGSLVSDILESQKSQEPTVQNTNVSPLFEANLSVKGVPLSAHQINSLYQELSNGELASVIEAEKRVGIRRKRLIQSSFSIEGVSVTRDELVQLEVALRDFVNQIRPPVAVASQS